MESGFETKTTRIFIAEEGHSIRQLLSDTFRNIGYREITVVATGKDVFDALKHDDCDWIIMPTFSQHEVNAFHVLKAVTEIPKLHHVRVSLLIAKEDACHLMPAFHYGLLSWHWKVYTQEHVMAEMSRLLAVMKSNNWATPLVAAEYFRTYMNANKQYDQLLDVERHLLGLFPGSLSLLLKYGETQLRAGRQKEGLGTLHQACLIDSRVKRAVDSITEKHANIRINTSLTQTLQENILGIKSCVIVDPDTSVLSALKKLLSQAGVPKIEVFDNGQQAWEWLSSNPEPELLILEWRIPGLPGPLLLQRIRHHGFCNVPVSIVSSVIKPEESHLLREFGVSNVIAKPFGPQNFFKSLVWTLQQHIFPTEQNSLQEKIKRLLTAGQLKEAERLKAAFIADPRIRSSYKIGIESQFAFCNSNYRLARDLAIEALKLQGDTLCLLNLLGKCLLKLGDYSSAMRIFEKAHRMSPINIETLCQLSIAQYDSGKQIESEATLMRAKELDKSCQMIGETECQLALLSGDGVKAKALMAELSSVGSVTAYMNNRAVSLTRSGRFDDGIKLYRKTIDAIPSRHSETRDTVTYNLGLAYARYGGLEAASGCLEEIMLNKESKVYRKALSLMKRIHSAISQKSPLSFYETVPDNDASARNDADQSSALIAEVTEVRAGSLCLHGIFHLSGSDFEQSKLLFENGPELGDLNSKPQGRGAIASKKGYQNVN